MEKRVVVSAVNLDGELIPLYHVQAGKAYFFDGESAISEVFESTYEETEAASPTLTVDVLRHENIAAYRAALERRERAGNTAIAPTIIDGRLFEVSIVPSEHCAWCGGTLVLRDGSPCPMHTTVERP